MLTWITDPAAWMALGTLTALEIVLGIDNIIFISILVGRLPEHQRALARRIGLILAMGCRLVLLVSLAWVMRLTEPLFTLFAQEISGRDLILLLGGLFLLAKSSHEIYLSVDHPAATETTTPPVAASFAGVLAQIALLDIIFSLDSVITAVGMAEHLPVMILAIIIAVGVMMFAATPLGNYVDRHPSLKILALSFLLLVGTSLIAEAFDVHIPKGYIYFSMAFSLAVELINLKIRQGKP